jgi:hypothetical protein
LGNPSAGGSMRFLLSILVAAAALPIGAASATPAARSLSFTRLFHGSGHVASAIRQPLGTWPLVIDSQENAPSTSDYLYGAQTPGLNEHNVERINRTDWRRRFVVGIFSTWPTRGYDVAIKRISLQHIGGGVQQLCLVAALHMPAPGRVVLQERTSVYDLVQVAREPTNLVAPSSVVVRGVHGRLLYANKDNHPVRPDVCHAR